MHSSFARRRWKYTSTTDARQEDRRGYVLGSQHEADALVVHEKALAASVKEWDKDIGKE